MRLRRFREAGALVTRIKVSVVGLQVSGNSVAEGETLRDSIHVGLVNEVRAAQAAPAFRAFGLAEVTAAGTTAQDFAAGGDFEPLGHRFLCFDTFGASHKFCFLPKEHAL
jgi:hypothetical protein